MKKKRLVITGSAIIAYLVLFALIIFNVLNLSNLYNKEELEMVMAVEREIEQAIHLENQEQLVKHMDDLREEYLFEVVITLEDDIIYNTIPYEIGNSLLGKTHPDAVAREAQGPYQHKGQEYFVWYSIYRLNDSVFVTSFLKTLLVIVLLVTALLVLTITLIFKGLFDPLNKLKKSIQAAKTYDFEDLEDEQDDVNKEFNEFTRNLQQDIASVSRKHTELEKQLQANREYLKNVLVVSRSMVHDFKTPLHRSLIESELALEQYSDNQELVAYAKQVTSINDELMKDINRTLKMLNQDDGFKKQKSTFDIVELLMKTSAQYNQAIKDKDLYLDLIAPERLEIESDESTLILLINNLMTNMVLYATEGSDLIVDVDRIDSQITLTFSNHSTPQNIERMKDSQQLFNAIKQESGEYVYSSGNGLYLIKELTHILEGEYRLEVDDELVSVTVIIHEA